MVLAIVITKKKKKNKWDLKKLIEEFIYEYYNIMFKIINKRILCE